jgi:hypothetical protein
MGVAFPLYMQFVNNELWGPWNLSHMPKKKIIEPTDKEVKPKDPREDKDDSSPKDFDEVDTWETRDTF